MASYNFDISSEVSSCSHTVEGAVYKLILDDNTSSNKVAQFNLTKDGAACGMDNYFAFNVSTDVDAMTSAERKAILQEGLEILFENWESTLKFRKEQEEYHERNTQEDAESGKAVETPELKN